MVISDDVGWICMAGVSLLSHEAGHLLRDFAGSQSSQWVLASHSFSPTPHGLTPSRGDSHGCLLGLRLFVVSISLWLLMSFLVLLVANKICFLSHGHIICTQSAYSRHVAHSESQRMQRSPPLPSQKIEHRDVGRNMKPLQVAGSFQPSLR